MKTSYFWDFWQKTWIKLEKPAGNHTKKKSEYGMRQMCTFLEDWGDPPVKYRVGESREK